MVPPKPRPALPASSRRQLNVPLEHALVDALKRRAAEEGVTLSHLVEQLLCAAMKGWAASPDLRMRLDDHEERLRRLENHPLLNAP